MQFFLAFLAAFILGVSKAGLKGMGILIVTLMALVYGAKASTGILLPMLIAADIMAVIYYKRHVQWKLLFAFLPWMIIGVLVGVFVGKDLPEELFKKGMAAIIIVSVLMMIYFEKSDQNKIPTGRSFTAVLGFAAGFTTMIGNLAGAFSNIFFLALRIPKNEFIGTAAWLFFIINLFKLPFHLFSWETVSLETLQINATLLPGIIIGFLVGIKVVARFKDTQYRYFILGMTLVGAVLLLLRN